MCKLKTLAKVLPCTANYTKTTINATALLCMHALGFTVVHYTAIVALHLYYSHLAMRSLCPDHFGAHESFLHTWGKSRVAKPW